MSRPPNGGSSWFGNVGAACAGADCPVEMLAELGMVLTNPDYRLADGAGHADSGPLGGRRGPSVAAMEADRARELSNEEVAFGVCLHLSLGVLERARLLDVVLDLGEAPAVRVLGSCVEHLAGIAGACVRHAGARAALGSRKPAALGATRASTWNSRPGSASNRARYRMPLRSRIWTVRPSTLTDSSRPPGETC
jgi:hypothetical protein